VPALSALRAAQPLELWCIHNTAKLDEKAVTSRLNEPPVMRSDRRVEQLSSYLLESLESVDLVRSNQARVACHIGSEDRGKTAGLAHAASPTAKRRPDKKSSRCSGSRRKLASGTTTGEMARSRSTIAFASSSRPIWAYQAARQRYGNGKPASSWIARSSFGHGREGGGAGASSSWRPPESLGAPTRIGGGRNTLP
jgi:hypothetical protein